MTYHQGSPNTRAAPRLALFSRWYHADHAAMRYDIGGILTDGNLWKYCAPSVAMSCVELGQ